MTTPNETIRAGLDAHERAKSSGGKAKLASLASAPNTIPKMTELRQVVFLARNRLSAIRTAAVEAMRKHREKVEAEYGDLGWVENENGKGRIDTLGASQRKRMIDGAIRKFQKEQDAKTADERATLLDGMQDAKAALDLVRDSWQSPVGVLMRGTLGSAKRATYAANLANAGPIEVNEAIREAVTSGDKELAAACCVRIDAMSRESRQSLSFTKSDVAEVLIGDEYAKAIEAIGLTDFAIAQGELADREARAIAVSPDEKIGVGLRLEDLKKRLGKNFDKDGNALDENGEPVVPANETEAERLNRLYPVRYRGDPNGGSDGRPVDGGGNGNN